MDICNGNIETMNLRSHNFLKFRTSSIRMFFRHAGVEISNREWYRRDLVSNLIVALAFWISKVFNIDPGMYVEYQRSDIEKILALKNVHICGLEESKIDPVGEWKGIYLRGKTNSFQTTKPSMSSMTTLSMKESPRWQFPKTTNLHLNLLLAELKFLEWKRNNVNSPWTFMPFT